MNKINKDKDKKCICFKFYFSLISENLGQTRAINENIINIFQF